MTDTLEGSQPAKLEHPAIPKEIAAALVQLQAKVETLRKTAENTHFKNTYAQLSDVQEAALPLLTDVKLALTQWPITVGGTNYLRSRLVHETGVSMTEDTELLLTKRDPQGLGSAITYTRRQTTMAILGLSANDDDDGNRASNHLPAPSQDQLDQIAQLCSDLKFPPEEVERRLKSLKTEDQATLAIDNLNQIISGRAASIKAREASQKAVIPIDADPEEASSRAGLRKRLTELGIKDKHVRELILQMTDKPFLENCGPKELAALDKALVAIESGKRSLPSEWYEAPSDDSTVIPAEPTA